jgi:hypothetical protein
VGNNPATVLIELRMEPDAAGPDVARVHCLALDGVQHGRDSLDNPTQSFRRRIGPHFQANLEQGGFRSHRRKTLTEYDDHVCELALGRHTPNLLQQQRLPKGIASPSADLDEGSSGEMSMCSPMSPTETGPGPHQGGTSSVRTRPTTAGTSICGDRN